MKDRTINIEVSVGEAVSTEYLSEPDYLAMAYPAQMIGGRIVQRIEQALRLADSAPPPSGISKAADRRERERQFYGETPEEKAARDLADLKTRAERLGFEDVGELFDWYEKGANRLIKVMSAAATELAIERGD